MDWTRTRSVLADLGKLLTCAICESYLKDPCTLDNCDHNFCRKCIEESLGSDSKCPECGSFSWLKDLRSNHQLATTVNMSLKLQSLIGLNMEVEDDLPQDASESSENTFTFGSDEELPEDNEEQEEPCNEFVSTTRSDTTPSHANVTETVSTTRSDTTPSHASVTETVSTTRSDTTPSHASVTETVSTTRSDTTPSHASVTETVSTTRSDTTPSHASVTETVSTTRSDTTPSHASVTETVSTTRSDTTPSHASITEPVSTTKSNIIPSSKANHVSTKKTRTRSAILKQDVRKSAAGKECNSKTNKQSTTASMDKDSLNATNGAINTTEDSNLLKHVSQPNSKPNKSNTTKSSRKIKQRTCFNSESEPTTETLAKENSLRIKESSNRNESTSIKKSTRTRKVASTTVGNGKNHETPSLRKRLQRSVDHKNSSSNKTVVKKYFFRNKLNKKDFNLAEAQFDFTQQQDPFHFADDDRESDDNNYHDNDDYDNDNHDKDGHDNDGHDNDGHDNDNHDDGHDNDGHDNDGHDNDNHDNDSHDNDDYDNDDGHNDDDDDNDGSKEIRFRCKSTNNILPQGHKTRNKSSFVHVQNTDGVLQSTGSAKTRLGNKGKTNVTAEQTQFTMLKERPRNLTQNDKSGIEEDNKKTSSNLLAKPDAKSKRHGIAGGEKGNVTLNVKRRRVRPKRNNIRQYLSEVDSADASDNLSDDVPVPQKRKKSRNPSTSSSQNSRNAGALSQSSRNKKGETPLHLAAIKGDLAWARELIKEGADPNEKDHAGWTSLHEACNHGHVGIVELFLDHGALLNIPGFDNDTPLHDAVANARLKVVQLLVARGAVLTTRNKQGLLPMDYAVTKKMKAALSPRGVSSSSKPAQDVVKKKRNSCIESPVVLGTALKTQDQITLKKCIKLLAGTLVDEFNESVTHVVSSVNENGHCPRTIKYMSGILTGKWIVSFEWIKDCLWQRQWLDEDIYEVVGSVGKTCNAARKARFNTLQQMPRLFDGCSFFLRGVFKPPTPSKEHLVKLILLGGGKLLHREPKLKDDDLSSLPSSPVVTLLSRAPEVAYHAPANSTLSCCTEFIVHDSASCDQAKIINSPVLRTAPVTWLMDCISSFQLLDIPDVA